MEVQPSNPPKIETMALAMDDANAAIQNIVESAPAKYAIEFAQLKLELNRVFLRMRSGDHA